MPKFSGIINHFQLFARDYGSPLLDGPVIAASLARAPGIAAATLRNTSPSVIEGTVNVSKINDFLASTSAAGFIHFRQGPSGQGGRCSINLSREMGPELLSLLSPEIFDFLDSLLAAPIATGEAMTKAEYLENIDGLASFFKTNFTDELVASSLQVYIDFPGTIHSIKNGTSNGRRAEFEIPLIDLLVLETPLSYEVEWR